MFTTACGPALSDMPVHDNTYSRVVAWLKIILPLLALAILSTLFLVARTINPAQDIPYADIDIDELAREQRISNPNFSAVTKDGAAISLSARSAKPDPDDPNRVLGTGIVAGITLRTGRSIAVDAEKAVIDQGTKLAGLHGGVTLTYSDGFAMQTEALEMALDATRLASNTKTVVTSKSGTLTSGKFVLTGDGSPSKPYLLVFKGKVRLLYRPGE